MTVEANVWSKQNIIKACGYRCNSGYIIVKCAEEFILKALSSYLSIHFIFIYISLISSRLCTWLPSSLYPHLSPSSPSAFPDQGGLNLLSPGLVVWSLNHNVHISLLLGINIYICGWGPFEAKSSGTWGWDQFKS